MTGDVTSSDFKIARNERASAIANGKSLDFAFPGSDCHDGRSGRLCVPQAISICTGVAVLTIWGRSNSINVQKVLWCCEELGLAYQRIDAGGAFGHTDDYAAINPNKLVPTLDDGVVQLWESNVIVRYLCHTRGMGSLCPSDPIRRFDAERWMDWQATVFWTALRPLFISLIRTAEADRDPKIISQATTFCNSAAWILNTILADREFVAGDQISMGDIPIGATVHRWFALDISRPKLPHLERWYRALQQRSAFSSTVMTPLS